MAHPVSTSFSKGWEEANGLQKDASCGQGTWLEAPGRNLVMRKTGFMILKVLDATPSTTD